MGNLDSYKMIDHVKSLLATVCNNSGTEFEVLWVKMSKMAEKDGITSLECPRLCSNQTQRNNVPAETSKEYFKCSVFIPSLGSILQQFSMRFSSLAKQAVQALVLLPDVVW